MTRADVMRRVARVKEARAKKADAFRRGVSKPDDFARALARQMLDSLHGGPMTVFHDTGESGKGSSRYRYFRTRSSNPDWYQHAPGKQERLREAVKRQAEGRPLDLDRQEDRWLREQTRQARRDGWCATYHGRESPICVDKAPKLERAHVGNPRRRLYLVLPERTAVAIAGRASSLHETPNRYLNEVLADHIERAEAAESDEDAPF